MNSPLFINVVIQPLSGNDARMTVASYGEDVRVVLGEGLHAYNKAMSNFELADMAGIEPPFNATFVDVRRLQNLTPEQAADLAKEWQIEIVKLPGSTAPSMGG